MAGSIEFRCLRSSPHSSGGQSRSAQQKWPSRKKLRQSNKALEKMATLPSSVHQRVIQESWSHSLRAIPTLAWNNKKCLCFANSLHLGNQTVNRPSSRVAMATVVSSPTKPCKNRVLFCSRHSYKRDSRPRRAAVVDNRPPPFPVEKLSPEEKGLVYKIPCNDYTSSTSGKLGIN